MNHTHLQSIRAEQAADLTNELRRRIADRNAPGYWGMNARAWVPIIIRKIREARIGTQGPTVRQHIDKFNGLL